MFSHRFSNTRRSQIAPIVPPRQNLKQVKITLENLNFNTHVAQTKMSGPRTRSSRKSLAEQVLALSDPKPTSFHPDEDLLEDGTAAKVCDFSYEEEDSPSLSKTSRIRTRETRTKRSGSQIEEDPKYAGKVVSRKELEALSPTPSGSEGEAGWRWGSGMGVASVIYYSIP